MEKYIAYYRVSTGRQGASGLGLDAQKTAVKAFLRDNKTVEEYTDIETGKNDNRPQLIKAIDHAKKTNSTLLIAKLDRLSRNLTFISTLMDAKVRFVCCDMPDANELTIHIFAALAQWERKRISARTSESLNELKKKRSLGTPANFTKEARELGPRTLKEIAWNNPNNQKARKIISLLVTAGKSYRQIAIELNESGFLTSKGCKFGPEQVRRLVNTKTPLLFSEV